MTRQTYTILIYKMKEKASKSNCNKYLEEVMRKIVKNQKQFQIVNQNKFKDEK